MVSLVIFNEVSSHQRSHISAPVSEPSNIFTGFVFRKHNWNVTETSYVAATPAKNISIKDHKNSTVVSRESKSEQFIDV